MPGDPTSPDENLCLLAEEEAALRRVATLVARESSPQEVFAAVAHGHPDLRRGPTD